MPDRRDAIQSATGRTAWLWELEAGQFGRYWAIDAVTASAKAAY